MSTDSSRPHKTCPKCGESLPATTEFFNANKNRYDGLNGWCRNCLKAWRTANRDTLLEKKRAYHHAHKHDEDYHQDRIERRRRYRTENIGKINEYNRQYRIAKRKQRREYDRVFSQKNPDYYRTYKRRWRAQRPEKILEYNMRRRTLRLSVDGQENKFFDYDWERSLAYFDNRCAVCGRLAGEQHTIAADHWIPLNHPNCPGTVPTNIVPLCHGRKGCNNSKCDSLPGFWLIEMFGIGKAKEILERIHDYFEWVKTQKDYYK